MHPGGPKRVALVNLKPQPRAAAFFCAAAVLVPIA
jgi:hypothetical protein